MSILQVQAEWSAIVEIIVTLILIIWYTLRGFYSGIASASELELLSWPVALTSFVCKILFICVHLLLAIYLHRSAKQRNDGRLRIWFYIRLILGILVLAIFILEIFSSIVSYGFNVYSIFLIVIIASWAYFIVYSLLIVRWLIKEIEHDYVMARTMYSVYSGRSPG